MTKPYPRYHYFTQLLHWVTFFTLLAVLGAVFVRELMEDDDLRLQLLNLHRSFGVIVLILVIIRLIVRYFFSQVTAALPKTLRRLASVGHFTLYTLLVVVPLVGWLFTSAAGKPLIFFGVVQLPALMQKNRDMAEVLGEVHEALAWIFIIVIVGHSAAALWHHFVRKDHVLLAMLPTWLTRK